MKIRLTFDLGPDERKAIGHLFGEKAASRERCVTWIESLVGMTLQELVAEREASLDKDH